jgi:hypothetical protein
LIHEPRTLTSTLAYCSQLNETLWDLEKASFRDGLNSSLSYQVYQENFPKDQLFWIAKANPEGALCTAINVQGTVSQVDCSLTLPGLCSQSAPVSTQQTSDDPTNYLVDLAANGKIYTGFRDSFVWKFRGVRFAPKPERFTYSTLYDQEGNFTVLKAGADCLQPIGEVRSGSSEDCLFLNIWTPYLPPMAGVPKSKLKPVMFYIYGGGFTSGSGKNPNTDGTQLASRGDVVAVSLNYRVSSLGFLAFKDGVHNGNYGIGDIVTGLEWVAKNIKYFGGDPDRVLIYGESAGAVAVRTLLSSPKAKGLFSNAISQSGPAGGSGGGIVAKYESLDSVYNRITLPVLNETGCLNSTNQLGCLREYNGTNLINLKNVAR